MACRPLWMTALLAAALSVSACMGIDVGSVRRADAPGSAIEPALAVASGRIRFVVDGRPMTYGLLNKPRLQLFHRDSARLMSSPEGDRDGRFRWQLPAGAYGVAVIHGGLSPTGQPHRLPGGALVFVNGIVDPGLEFVLRPGQVHALGTLVVEVESRPPRDVLFGSERVFGRLLGIHVVDDAANEEPATPGSAAPSTSMRRITRPAMKPPASSAHRSSS